LGIKKYNVNLGMVRTIVIPDTTHIELDIPAEYVGKPIEIIYQALEEGAISSKKTMRDFLGVLSDKSARKLHRHIKKVRGEWDRDI
jgi:hypothetical protein